MRRVWIKSDKVCDVWYWIWNKVNELELYWCWKIKRQKNESIRCVCMKILISITQMRAIHNLIGQTNENLFFPSQREKKRQSFGEQSEKWNKANCNNAMNLNAFRKLFLSSSGVGRCVYWFWEAPFYSTPLRSHLHFNNDHNHKISIYIDLCMRADTDAGMQPLKEIWIFKSNEIRGAKPTMPGSCTFYDIHLA